MKLLKQFSLIVVLSGFVLNVFAASEQQKSDALVKLAQDIPKFYMVDAGKVFRGGRPQIEDIKTLKLAGIKTIIDLQGGDFDLLGKIVAMAEPGELEEVMLKEKQASLKLGINWIPQRLSSFTMTSVQQANVTKTLEIMKDPKMQPVFIHCEFGKDRTGLVAALYEVLNMGEQVQVAHERWVASGHTGQFNRYATIMLDYYFYKVTSGMPLDLDRD